MSWHFIKKILTYWHTGLMYFQLSQVQEEEAEQGYFQHEVHEMRRMIEKRVDKSYIFFPHVWKLRQKRKKKEIKGQLIERQKGNWERKNRQITAWVLYFFNLLNRKMCAQPLPFSCHRWKHCTHITSPHTTRNSLFFSINTADMDWDLAKTQSIQQQQRNMPHVA